MKFLRNLLAAILGCLIAFGILFVMFFFFAALIGNAGDGVVVKENSVLKISINEPIYDYYGSDDNDPFAGLFEEGQGLDEILHAISVAKTDNRIQGISIKNNFLLAGLAQTQELRKALEDFKKSGKKVYALSDYYSQKDYYLASVADKVFMNPQGLMDFKGLSSEVLYYKELQEKTGIKMEVIRHGKYKSAVEPFLSDTMSAENRIQIRELLDSVWNQMLTDIAFSRDMSIEGLNGIADTLGARTPQMAVNSGLLDGLRYQDEYQNDWKETLGVDEDDDIDVISLTDYVSVSKNKNLPTGKDKVAIVFAQGEILYGEGNRDIIGQGTLMRALKKARENDNIKAVVLRVNSPGGSSLVSDIIWREVVLTKEVKPVVVSFGNVAASGGYYLAVGADKIFAEPTTITGSIGVFGTIPNIHELSKDIGINAEQVGTNTNAIDYSFFEPMKEGFRKQLEEGVEMTYETFLERVAEGRGMTKEAVNEVAQGRVWSGVDALKLGLVDELGNLDDAISAAAQMAGLDSHGIRKYPKYKSDFERLMEDFSSAKLKIGESIIQDQLGTQTFQNLKELKRMIEQKGIQTRMPYNLNIQ
ncbi:MAG: signal peptide peptidase SppA [Bacteroidota bacterium]